jgi:hypothetical protein
VRPGPQCAPPPTRTSRARSPADGSLGKGRGPSFLWRVPGRGDPAVAGVPGISSRGFPLDSPRLTGQAVTSRVCASAGAGVAAAFPVLGVRSRALSCWGDVTSLQPAWVRPCIRSPVPRERIPSSSFKDSYPRAFPPPVDLFPAWGRVPIRAGRGRQPSGF